MTPLTSLCAPAETSQHSDSSLQKKKKKKKKGVTLGQITIWSWTRRSRLLLAQMDINMSR